MTIDIQPVLPLAAGLTEADAQRIATALEAALAPSSRTVYDHAWSRWESWAMKRGVSALPADPAAVCAFLTERAAEMVSSATVEVACCAIGHRHRSLGLPDPMTDLRVRQVRRGLRRLLGPQPRRIARPLDVEDIRRLVTCIDRTTSMGIRDAAIILAGFASALRVSELAALTLADVEHQTGGLLLHIRVSKTDPDARGQVVGIVHGRHTVTDPVAALDAWLRRRGHSTGPLFTSMAGTYRTGEITMTPISGNAIARMLRKRALAAGVPAQRVTGHSLRAGHATTAALAGVSLDRIAAQTRHKRISVLLERYIRPTDALRHTSSKDLGL